MFGNECGSNSYDANVNASSLRRFRSKNTIGKNVGWKHVVNVLAGKKG